tara:strand:+ start:209 stop:520 length:312 start_codon:yes stop_codon:yes gene_type:complete
MTILEAILSVFFVSAVAFGWLYIKYLISQIQQRSDDIFIIREMLRSYDENLKAVYESEMYYGEPILQNLVDHSKFLNEELDAIMNDYDFSEYQGSEPPLEDQE